jgi:hypothetical protein
MPGKRHGEEQIVENRNPIAPCAPLYYFNLRWPGKWPDAFISNWCGTETNCEVWSSRLSDEGRLPQPAR